LDPWLREAQLAVWFNEDPKGSERASDMVRDGVRHGGEFVGVSGVSGGRVQKTKCVILMDGPRRPQSHPPASVRCGVDRAHHTERPQRVVHQSVKEFIIKEWAATPAATDEAQFLQRTECLEAGVLNICIGYLLLHEIGNVDLCSEESLAIEELPQYADLFDDYCQPDDYDAHCSWKVWEQNMLHYDPTERGFGELFVYASCHWVEHFGAVSFESLLPALDDIELVCQVGSKRLSNWIAQIPVRIAPSSPGSRLTPASTIP
jgi:hypothetical protein